MPEAAVDEDGNPLPGEDEICGSAKCWYRSYRDAVAETEGVNGSPNGQLGGCVPSAIRLHGRPRRG